MDENDGSWSISDLLHPAATNTEMWLSSPEELECLGTPTESFSRTRLEFPTEHASATVLDFDLSFDDFLKDVHGTGRVDRTSNPEGLMDISSGEGLSGSAGAISSRHSHHRTRHTQSSLARFKDFQSDIDLDVDEARPSKISECMWETASEDLRGFGGHFELQPADEHGEGRSGASVQYPQDILVAELQGLHYVQPANSPIYLQGFESQSDDREHQQTDENRMSLDQSSERMTDVSWPLEVEHVMKLDEGVLSVEEWFGRVPMDLHFRVSLESCNLPSSPPIRTEGCMAAPFLDNYESTHQVSTGVPFLDLPRRLGPRNRGYAGSAQGSVSSCGDSIMSAVSGASYASHASWSGRKGRRKQITNGNSPEPQPFNSKRPYQCTWCWTSFRKPSDWRRHEESQHAPQTEWVCMPDGPAISVSGGQGTCVMCGQTIGPDSVEFSNHSSHVHNQRRCLARTSEDRRFDRKDHLVQHLRNTHHITITKSYPIGIKDWEKPLFFSQSEPLWSCGFCDVPRMPWFQRYVHVAEHMKGGSHGTTWRRCICSRSGLQPETLATLQKIGLEEIFFESCRKIYPAAVSSTRSGQRQNSTGLFDAAPPLFWCGFCRKIFETSSANGYNCERLNHFSRFHRMSEPVGEYWYEMRGTAEAAFRARGTGLSYEDSSVPPFCSRDRAQQLLDDEKQLWKRRLMGSEHLDVILVESAEEGGYFP